MTRKQWPTTLRRLRWAGFLVLAVELIYFLWFGALQVHRFSIAIDYSLYNQPTFLVSRGHLNPYSSVWGFPFWKNDGEFVFWGLAVIVRLFSDLGTLKALQTLSIVATQAVAFDWLCEMVVSRHVIGSEGVAASEGAAARWAVAGPGREPVAGTSAADRSLLWPAALIALGVLLLVANPWFLWTIADDVHSESFAALPLILMTRSLWRGRTSWAFVWAFATMVCGAGAASYAVAVGFGFALCGRRWWRAGLTIAVVGLIWVTTLSQLGATLGPAIGAQYGKSLGGALKHHFSGPGLVAAILAHPGRAVHGFWSNKLNLWATVAPAGLIGLCYPIFLLPTVVVLAEGALAQGHGSAIPSFQNIVLAPLITVGTVAWLLWLGDRFAERRRLRIALVCLLVANGLGWAITWLPTARSTWVTVPASSASALSTLRSEIPRADEVITEHGVAGGFSDRKYLYALENARAGVPIQTRTVWLIFTPRVGIEFAQPGPSYADIQQVAELPGAKMVMAGDGVWAFRWTVPVGTKTLELNPDGTGTPQMTWQANLSEILALREHREHDVSGTTFKIPGWLVTGTAATADHTGAAAGWHAAATGAAGYVVDQAYFMKVPGNYTAQVNLAVSGLGAGSQVRIEVRNTKSGRLLGSRDVGVTHGRVTVSLPVTFKHLVTTAPFSGGGPFSISTIPPIYGNNLELRVSSPGDGAHIAVYWLSLS